MKQPSSILPLTSSVNIPILMDITTYIDRPNTQSNRLLNQWIGRSKSDCLEYCRANTLQIISFAHWLSIPERQIVLTFKYQNCVEVIQNVL